MFWRMNARNSSIRSLHSLCTPNASLFLFVSTTSCCICSISADDRFVVCLLMVTTFFSFLFLSSATICRMPSASYSAVM